MGHRETTAWELAARLTEVLLQLGGVRHGATRTIHDEDPMAEPATFVVDVRAAGVRQERVGHATKQALEDSQRKPLACFAKG
jgi:hypothetical protein